MLIHKNTVHPRMFDPVKFPSIKAVICLFCDAENILDSSA